MSATLTWTCDVCHLAIQKDITSDAAAGGRVFAGYPEAQGWKAGWDCDLDVCCSQACHDEQAKRELYVPEEDHGCCDDACLGGPGDAA